VREIAGGAEGIAFGVEADEELVAHLATQLTDCCISRLSIDGKASTVEERSNVMGLGA
jgi:hypothetical protein